MLETVNNLGVWRVALLVGWGDGSDDGEPVFKYNYIVHKERLPMAEMLPGWALFLFPNQSLNISCDTWEPEYAGRFHSQGERKPMVKTTFIGFRVTPEDRQKLIELSQMTDQPGSMSAGFRLALDSILDTKEFVIERIRFVAAEVQTS